MFAGRNYVHVCLARLRKHGEIIVARGRTNHPELQDLCFTVRNKVPVLLKHAHYGKKPHK